MKALVTGSHGTIGTALCQMLHEQHSEIVHWNRQEVPIDDYYKMEAFVQSSKPDILFHLAYASDPALSSEETWKINYEWASELAWITKLAGVKFLFTSTNLVFSHTGPYTLHSSPDALNGYGYEKKRAEERIRYQNADAIIVRLGWQIGDQPGSNNMIDYFDRKMREEGAVKASINWKPACSFLEDTCEKLQEIASSASPGLYMIDSNERWNFFEIATTLNQLHGNSWKIVKTEEEGMDTRMIDDRVTMPLLSERLNLQ